MFPREEDQVLRSLVEPLVGPGLVTLGPDPHGGQQGRVGLVDLPLTVEEL